MSSTSPLHRLATQHFDERYKQKKFLFMYSFTHTDIVSFSSGTYLLKLSSS